nr:gag pol polyprotein [Hymenolepis microstoma]
MSPRVHHVEKPTVSSNVFTASSSQQLSLLLLAISSTIKEDLGCCSAELVLSTTISLPGEMFANPQDRTLIDPSSYSARLKEHFRSIFPTPTVDTVKKQLQPPYDGPSKVLKRKSKLKPTYLEPTPKPESAVPIPPSNSTAQSFDSIYDPTLSSLPRHHILFPKILRIL